MPASTPALTHQILKKNSLMRHFFQHQAEMPHQVCIAPPRLKMGAIPYATVEPRFAARRQRQHKPHAAMLQALPLCCHGSCAAFALLLPYLPLP